MKKRWLLAVVLLGILLGACVPDPVQDLGSVEKSVPAADQAPILSTQTPIPDVSSGSEITQENEPGTPNTAPSVIPTLKAQPAPEKGQFTRGNVYPDGYDVVDWDSEPGQKALKITGMLPTPCDKLRYDVAEPDQENRIEIDLYSVSDPEQICVQVLVPFEVDIPLGELPPGEYTIWVNGKLAGELHL